MKKILFSLLCCLYCLNALAQEETSRPKSYRNEFGLDITNFVGQFLNLNTTYGPYYAPQYYLTYRRHFRPGNIRFAVGGSYSSQEIPAAFAVDSNKYFNNSRTVDFRIGWEFVSELSRRWQVYYGADFRPSFGYSKNDAPYWNGGYANGSESKFRNFGIAPVLGIRFRINDRLSLTTESSFSINFQNTSSRRYFIPVNSQYPPLPDVEHPDMKRTFTSFAQPLSLILTFDI